MNVTHQRRMSLVQVAYEKFREKWDISLPVIYPNDLSFVRKLRERKVNFNEYQEPFRYGATDYEVF